jgi:hypothetical protein
MKITEENGIKTYEIEESDCVDKGWCFEIKGATYDGNLEVSLSKTLVVMGDEIVYGDHIVRGNHIIEGFQIVGGNQTVEGFQTVGGYQTVGGNQTVKDYQIVRGDQVVEGKQRVKGYQVVEGYQAVEGYQVVEGYQTVVGCQTVGGYQTVRGNQIVRDSQVVRDSQIVRGDQLVAGDQKVRYKSIPSLSRHLVQYSAATIKIGCREKTAEEWEKWFAGDEVYLTPRSCNTFKDIEKAFRIAATAQKHDRGLMREEAK